MDEKDDCLNKEKNMIYELSRGLQLNVDTYMLYNFEILNSLQEPIKSKTRSNLLNFFKDIANDEENYRLIYQYYAFYTQFVAEVLNTDNFNSF